MKARALSVKECAWTSEECHLVDELRGDAQTDNLCLPNIFRSRKVKPLTKNPTSPTFQVYYTAKELLLEAFDRDAVRGLIGRASGVRPGANWPPQGQNREQSTDLSEEEYAEALSWFSMVFQSGLSAGEECGFASELTHKLDARQGVLKRNGIQTSLLSLTRLEDRDKLDTLSALCSHITRRYQALHTPGPDLAVRKYTLSYQSASCPLCLALLWDLGSGFICNMYLYSPGQLQKQSRKPVVEQVIKHLLRPFCSHRHLVQLDSSAWMDGKLSDIFSGSGVIISFVPTVEKSLVNSASASSAAVTPHQDQRLSGASASQPVALLRGWTGPAMFPQSDLKGSVADAFLPGIWVTLHVICINTFVLHTLQNQGSGRKVQLTEFTRTLVSQLVVDSSVPVTVLPRLNSYSYQGKGFKNLSKQRSNNLSAGQKREHEKQRRSSTVTLQNKPGVCGLDNSGNSCYLNAVLQCLCSTVPLVEHLLNQETRKELAKSKCRVAEVLVRLLEQMWLGRGSSCAPVEARSVLCSILPQFNNFSQQDAQELLLFLLNAFHDDLKKVAKRQMRLTTRLPSQERNKNCASEPTIVSHLFEGRLSYATLCMHCNYQANSAQAFTVLSLPIPTHIIKCSIQDCLSLFFEQTVLTGAEQMLCSVCGLRRETAVLTCLEKAPEILTLHLKRFGCRGRSQVKLRTNVVFSMKLDLSPFVSSTLQNDSYSSYHLYAVVNHTGNLNMGHYTALCLSAPVRAWHCFDDSEVTEVQDSLVQSPNAYMLLYSRKPFQKPKIHGL